jgi:hypothetical protein
VCGVKLAVMQSHIRRLHNAYIMVLDVTLVSNSDVLYATLAKNQHGHITALIRIVAR